VVLGVILVAIIAGIAGAAMRKKKEPPAKAMPPEGGQLVRWE
jgi:Na+/H+-dicarboxylate symporter